MVKNLQSKDVKTAQSQCPSCGIALSKTPKRKTRCPQCGATIVVRKGKLVTGAGQTPAKRPESVPARKRAERGKESAAGVKDSSSPEPAKSPGSQTLEAELAFYANEVYTKGDWEAGRQLVIEGVGALALGGSALAFLTVWLPGVGIVLSSGMVVFIMSKVAEFYNDLNAEDRKQVRAFVKELRKALGF